MRDAVILYPLRETIPPQCEATVSKPKKSPLLRPQKSRNALHRVSQKDAEPALQKSGCRHQKYHALDMTIFTWHARLEVKCVPEGKLTSQVSRPQRPTHHLPANQQILNIRHRKISAEQHLRHPMGTTKTPCSVRVPENLFKK